MHVTTRSIAWMTAAAVLLLASRPTLAQQANLREISLVRQDFSDCANGNVSDKDVSLVGGTAIVVRNGDGTSTVKVFITASANTKYNFFLKCVRSLGQITTYDEGEGEAQFTFRTNETGDSFGFDMYPDGAPAGNKFQSVQVKF
jgi:hypothetical protein